MSRILLVFLGLLLTVGSLASCGGDEDSTGKPATGGSAEASARADLQHIHGLGVAADRLFIATHNGLWAAQSGTTKPRPVGTSRQDIMGFSVVGDERFIGSGHPGPSQTNLPPNLGFIESRDGGRTWKSISLMGEVDFHVLQSAGAQIYGVNSADGSLMASSDGGRKWEKRTPPAGVFGLAIDPRSSRHIVASTERGVFASQDAGERWRPLNTEVGGLLTWPTADQLYLVGGDGTVQVSSDGGRRWQPSGNIGGQPAAFISDGSDLYAALVDASVKRSADGGRSWTLRAAP